MVQFKCSECDMPAEWMYIDEITPRLAPLCDEHMKEILMMEGEVNVQFFDIENVEGWLQAINHLLQFREQKYLALLKEFSKLKEKIGDK
ncbi:hypothetical protein DRP04_11350 [Archaeoglobales archaeon]|nr:MAG: hypothetical protein DRP04_11350 [Archaeoglobales archaeon]